MSACANCRCEELEERIAFLEAELGIRVDHERFAKVRETFGLRPSEMHCLIALHAAKGRLVLKAQLEDAIPPADHAAPREGEVVDVYICRLRKALGKDTIRTVWGQGYRLSPAGYAKIDPLLSTLSGIAA